MPFCTHNFDRLYFRWLKNLWKFYFWRFLDMLLLSVEVRVLCKNYEFWARSWFSQKQKGSKDWSLENSVGLLRLKFGSLPKTATFQERCDEAHSYAAWSERLTKFQGFYVENHFSNFFQNSSINSTIQCLCQAQTPQNCPPHVNIGQFKFELWLSVIAKPRQWGGRGLLKALVQWKTSDLIFLKISSNPNDTWRLFKRILLNYWPTSAKLTLLVTYVWEVRGMNFHENHSTGSWVTHDNALCSPIKCP